MTNSSTPSIPLKFRSDVTVELVKHSASDSDVVWAARVSTAGERSNADAGKNQDASEHTGLVNFLMRERHGTPFEHSIFTFYVKAPIFVWREHMRHRIASYNEESGRYRQLDPEFYFPNTSRNLQQVGKTGSYTFEPGTPEQYKITEEEFKKSCETSYASYEKMLQAGVAREVARGVLPAPDCIASTPSPGVGVPLNKCHKPATLIKTALTPMAILGPSPFLAGFLNVCQAE